MLQITEKQVCRCQPRPRIMCGPRGLQSSMSRGIPSGRFYLGREACQRCGHFRVTPTVIEQLDRARDRVEIAEVRPKERKLWGAPSSPPSENGEATGHD